MVLMAMHIGYQAIRYDLADSTSRAIPRQGRKMLGWAAGAETSQHPGGVYVSSRLLCSLS